MAKYWEDDKNNIVTIFNRTKIRPAIDSASLPKEGDLPETVYFVLPDGKECAVNTTSEIIIGRQPRPSTGWGRRASFGSRRPACRLGRNPLWRLCLPDSIQVNTVRFTASSATGNDPSPRPMCCCAIDQRLVKRSPMQAGDAVRLSTTNS